MAHLLGVNPVPHSPLVPTPLGLTPLEPTNPPLWPTNLGPKGVGPREWAVGVGIRVFMGPNVVGPEASKGWSQVDGPQLGGTGSQCGGTQ